MRNHKRFCRSQYLRMRDGVNIAIDYWLPQQNLREKLPTIIQQTRYFRRIDWRFLLRFFGFDTFLDINASTRDAFLRAGYVWVDVDTRGSGASSGSRLCPWSKDEIQDGKEIVDWVVRQPWSNGRIGTTGVSYGGTCAEFLLQNRHPAVKASVPRFSLFDVYPDVAFPGGLHLAWFSKTWSRFNKMLDQNTFEHALAIMLRTNTKALCQWLQEKEYKNWYRLFHQLDSDSAQHFLSILASFAQRGVMPTDEDTRRILLTQFLRDHLDNLDVHEGAKNLVYRDDKGVSSLAPEESIDVFSPHTYLEDIIASEAAVYSYSGWMDGAYQNAAIKRHLNLPAHKSKLLIGPWDHGGRQNISSFSPKRLADFNHDNEMLRFFDYHVKQIENGLIHEAPVRYFTLGQERWKHADTWPPPESQVVSWYLVKKKTLSLESSSKEGHDKYRVEFSLGTGVRSRWRSLVGLAAPVGYAEKIRGQTIGLSYTSAPLHQSLELTGHPLLHLFLSSTATDGALFAYLEDVFPAGNIRYVTEGQLRLLHRKISSAPPPYRSATPYRSFTKDDAAPLQPGNVEQVTLGFLPISYQFQAGNCIRLTLTGADQDHFTQVLLTPPTLSIHWGVNFTSRLELPIIQTNE